MEDFVRQSLLYDFYGDLLTEHQKEIFGAAVLEDMSLGEIAAAHGISRQGVSDCVKRCKGILEGYEEKLGLVKKFLEIRERVEDIGRAETIEEARKISGEILELL